uniref:Immunoglobulin domain-containing protein n=1 Tax=Sinocyclocheilus anshuiensis TaxID=1608454 RepID=A0A671QRW7_9TELE
MKWSGCLDLKNWLLQKSTKMPVTFHTPMLSNSETSYKGEYVRLQTGVTELQKDDEILWNFEPKNALIAKIDGQTNKSTVYDVGDDGFRDRLELDDRTGDLTITNTRSTDSGVYELQIKSSNKVLYKKFNVLVWMNNLKYTVGDSVTLQTGVTELRNDVRILWKFSDKDTFIAELNQIFSLYDVDDGRFEDRLQLDNKTGSLIISDIRTKHSGDYHLKIISNETFLKTFSVTVHGEKLRYFYTIFMFLFLTPLLSCLFSRCDFYRKENGVSVGGKFRHTENWCY